MITFTCLVAPWFITGFFKTNVPSLRERHMKERIFCLESLDISSSFRFLSSRAFV